MSDRCTCTLYGHCVVCRPAQPRREPIRRDSLEWVFGQWGETVVSRWLEEQGCWVLPARLIENGGAPAVTRLRERLTLPDIQAFGQRGGWWEVKTKTSAIAHAKSGQDRHGIDESLWHQYLAVERETDLPGYLAIVQLKPRQLLAQSFEVLKKWVYTHDGSTDAYKGRRLVFWNVNDFEQVNARSDLIDLTLPPEPPPVQRQPRPWDHPPKASPRQPRLWDNEL